MTNPGINNEGPEGKNVMGEFAETEIEAFFSNFVNWKLIYKNVDLKSLKHPNENKYENRGYDFIYKLHEPFDISNGIIIETKKVGDISSFKPSILTEHIEILKYKIDKANHSKELYKNSNIMFNNINLYRYGILCYRFFKFDLDKYYNVLKQIEITDQKTKSFNFPTIFVLSNDRLHAFSEWKKLIKGRLTFYDRDPLSTNHLVENEKMSLFHLFSDIIPFSEYDSNSNKSNGILSFDKPKLESFLFIEDFCRNFEFNISKIIFVNCDISKSSLYDQDKSKITSFKNIVPDYCGPMGPDGMDCNNQKLDKVFI